MPSVRLNRMLALALAALATPAFAGPASPRREVSVRAPASQAPISPVVQQPIAPGVGQWSAGSAPRELRSLAEIRRIPEASPLVLPVSGAVALLEVAPPPSEASRPKGFTALLDIDEVHPAQLQRPVAKRPALMLEAAPSLQSLTPGSSR